MITFFVCLALLVTAYFTYGRYLERVCRIDPAAEVPSKRLCDGVDYVPMPLWRTFLIQLLNIAGGMTLTEPAADLALVLAVASSRWNVSPGTDFAAMGEVGLAGEVRAIAHAQRRVDECVRLGFRRIVLPRANLRQIQAPEGAQIVGVSTVLEATALLKRTNRANAQEGE